MAARVPSVTITNPSVTTNYRIDAPSPYYLLINLYPYVLLLVTAEVSRSFEVFMRKPALIEVHSSLLLTTTLSFNSVTV